MGYRQLPDVAASGQAADIDVSPRGDAISLASQDSRYAFVGQIRIFHTPQIGDIIVPYVFHILSGAAAGSMIESLGDLAVVDDVLARDSLHRAVRIGCGGVSSPIDLTIGGVAEVKALGAMLIFVLHAIGFGAKGLGLQRFNRPRGAHLVGNHAFQVVVHLDYVDHSDVVSIDPVVFKAAIIFVSLEPGLSLVAPGLDSQAMAAAVQFE